MEALSEMVERRVGRRIMVAFPVTAEWTEPDNDSSRQMLSEGETINIGSNGAMVRLDELPRVGERLRLSVHLSSRDSVSVEMDVIRLDRNFGGPQVALSVSEDLASWDQAVDAAVDADRKAHEEARDSYPAY